MAALRLLLWCDGKHLLGTAPTSALQPVCAPRLSDGLQETPIEPMTEKRMVTAILDRLEKDTSNDVQAIAVKTLGLLVRRVPRDLVEDICVRLGKHLLEGRDELRCVQGLLHGGSSQRAAGGDCCSELLEGCGGLQGAVEACWRDGRARRASHACWERVDRAAWRAFSPR